MRCSTSNGLLLTFSARHLANPIIEILREPFFLPCPQFMNQRELFRRRNQVRQMLGIMNRHRNVLKWSCNETDKHINMKFNICKYLRKMKKEFYTEAIFVGGLGRADIINADDAVIYEVYQTESRKSLEMKAKKYPLDVIFVKANQEFKEELIL